MTYYMTVIVTNLTKQEVYECDFNCPTVEKAKIAAVRRFAWAGLLEENDKYTVEVRPLV